MKNLEGSIKHGRNFGLRSCLRIRCSGCLHPTRSKITPSQGRVTIKFEAFLPNVSFNARQIQPLPIQLTPLSQILTLGRPGPGSPSPHQMGYLTLTETRKVLILNETDTLNNNLLSAPVVGVWISLPDLVPNQEDAVPMLFNPIIWGCCLRYICNQNILEKVWVDERTFLFVYQNPYLPYFLIRYYSRHTTHIILK